MKKIVISLLALFLLVGCNPAKESVKEQTNTDATSMDSFDDTYYKIVNLNPSELRESFYLDYGSRSDFQTIGRGLQLLSADYFSTSSHYMSEGQYLKLTLKNEMVSRKSDYSLQPASGTTIENVTDPVMVQDIVEQDYYVKEGSDYTLKGLSLAIIIDPRTNSNGQLASPMQDSAIESYGKEVIGRLYDVINKHEDFEKVKNLPILITVYHATDTTTSSVNGTYILKSYCNKEVGEIQKVNYENVIFTSTRASELDNTTLTEFNVIKTNLKAAATEAAGLVGTARYQDDKIQSMVIEANLNVKTYTELLYLASLIADNIDSQFTYDFSIKVLVKSQDQLQTVIIKEKGQKAQSYELY